MGEKAAIAGVIIRHAGVIAGCVLFFLPLYGLGILSGAVTNEVTSHSPGIAMAFILVLPITVSPPILVILGSLVIPGDTRHSVIPRIVVTEGLFVALGIAVVIVGPFIGLVIWLVFDFHSPVSYMLFLLVPSILGTISMIRGMEVDRQSAASHGH